METWIELLAPCCWMAQPRPVQTFGKWTSRKEFSCYLSIKIYKLLEKNKRPVCEELIIQLGRGHSGKANRSENALSGCWKWGSSSTSGKPPTSRTSGLIRTTTRVRSMMKYVSQNQLRPQVRLVTRCHNDAVVPLASWQQLHPKSEAAVAVWYGLHHP